MPYKDTNNGNAAGNDVEIVDTIRPEMRIDAVNVPAGVNSVVNGQQVTVTIGTLNPDQSVVFTINTTVLRSPVNSNILDNTASIVGTAVTDTAQVTVRTRYAIVSPLAVVAPQLFQSLLACQFSRRAPVRVSTGRIGFLRQRP